MIYEIIEELRSNNSRLFKEAVLEKYKDNQQLKEVLYATLSPRKQYYIRKIPKYVENKSNSYVTFDKAFEMLEDLNLRVYTGHSAIEYLQNILSTLKPNDAKLLELIIQKDLKCGVNVSTVNKIFPNLVEETPYQRCSLLKDLNKDKIDWTKGLYSQEKLDGMFANVIFNKDKHEILSRNGSKFPIEPFTNILKDLDGCAGLAQLVFHGELVVYQADELLKREIGNGILNSLLQTGEFDTSQYSIHFVVWDVISFDNFFNSKFSSTPYKIRFNELKNILDSSGTPNNSVSICPTKIVYSFEEAKQHYKELALLGKEGTILKNPESFWKDSTSKDMWKFKVEAEVELRVKGFTKGNGKNEKTFGSINMHSEDGLLEVNVSGMKDDVREKISNNREDYIDKIIPVVFNNIMKSEGKKASMFLPRTTGELRLDKTEANTLKEIEDIFESVLND